MLSISEALSDPEYLIATARINYWTEGGDPLGRWYGGAREAFGVSGTVQPDDIRNLFRGMSIDGSHALVQNPNHKDRQCAWDLTFSVDKSVSVALAVSSPKRRAAIERAIELSVCRALDFIEKEAGLTRRGKGSTLVEPAKLLFALYPHVTSRAEDPQWHVHCVLLNLSARSDGTTGSILTKPIFRLKMIAGLIFRQELAHQLRENLGFELQPEKSWFTVAGIPQGLMDMFSKRRQEVLDELEKMGRTDAVAAAAATKNTRKGKELKPRAELYDEWSRQARAEYGFTQESLEALIQLGRSRPGAVRTDPAIESLLKDQSYFTDRQFLRRVLERHQATGHSADQILTSVRETLSKLIDLGIHDGHRLYSTREVVRQEQDLLAKAMGGQTSTRHLVSQKAAEKVGRDLSPGQRSALRHILVEPGDIKLIQGLAGTGKSSLLKAANQAWIAAGYHVVGAAYSGKAAEGLSESSEIASHTVDRLLFQWAKERSAVRPLDKKSILVVDEAGMLDTLKLGRLIERVKAAGAKLILVGDEKQLPPIAAGAPFPELGRRLGRGELTEIHRQKNELLRMVVENLAGGNITRALRLLNHDKLLRLHDSPDSARDALIADWAKAGMDRKSLILAGTREDVRDLNLRAQAARAKAWDIGLSLFTIQQTRFHLGERVVFGKNDRLLGVLNGSLGEFKAYDPFKNIATFKLDTGKTVYIPLQRYRSIDLGYSITTHRAQGATVDRSFILWSDGMQSREMTYVQASRARLMTRFYLTHDQAGPNFADALRDMERSVAKDLAIGKAREAKREPSREVGMSPSL